MLRVGIVLLLQTFLLCHSVTGQLNGSVAFCESGIAEKCVQKYFQSYKCLLPHIPLPADDECAPYVTSGNCLQQAPLCVHCDCSLRYEINFPAACFDVCAYEYNYCAPGKHPPFLVPLEL